MSYHKAHTTLPLSCNLYLCIKKLRLLFLSSLSTQSSVFKPSCSRTACGAQWKIPIPSNHMDPDMTLLGHRGAGDPHHHCPKGCGPCTLRALGYILYPRSPVLHGSDWQAIESTWCSNCGHHFTLTARVRDSLLLISVFTVGFLWLQTTSPLTKVWRRGGLSPSSAFVMMKLPA